MAAAASDRGDPAPKRADRRARIVAPCGRIAERLRRRLRDGGISALTVLAARALGNLNGLLLSVALVRRFGLAAAGSLALASTGTIVLATVCTFGLPQLFARLDLPRGARNTLGLGAAVAALLVAAPVAILLGDALGRTPNEARVIALLAVGGAYFAQGTLSGALLVLENRLGLTVLAPLAATIGIVAADAFARDLAGFVLILASCRLVGGLAAYAWLPLGRLRPAIAARLLGTGLRYLAAEIANLTAEQASVVIASAMLPRAALGVLGLCRQLVSVADTPGATALLVWYPALCRQPGVEFRRFRARMTMLGLLSAAALALVAIPAGEYVYRSPALVLLGPLALLATPLRYGIAAYQALLQALGAFRSLGLLALGCALAITAVPLGIWLAGLPGAAAGTVAQMALGVALVRPIALRALESRAGRASVLSLSPLDTGAGLEA